MAPLCTFQLPDLLSRCTYPLRYHENGDAIAAASDSWYEKGCSNFTEEKRRKLSVLAAGKLSAYAYHDTDDDRLRCICDFMQLIFHYGDVSEGLMIKGNEMVADIVMNAFWFPDSYRPTHATDKIHPKQEPDLSKLSRDLWLRCTRDGGSGFHARLRENLGLFFDARHIQATHRQAGVIPTTQDYIDIRRDSSGLKPLMDFLEYTLHIDLPDCVVEDPFIRSLKQSVNDFCTWSNDIFSFNKEQACGETYNTVIILMKVEGRSLQDAVGCAGDMCFKALDTFRESRRSLPTWGLEIDRDVDRYVRSLEGWLTANLHWSFMSGRYFGAKGPEIKKTRIVELIRPRPVMRDIKN